MEKKLNRKDKRIHANCYVYEVAEGEIDDRFDPGSQGLSIIPVVKTLDLK